MKIRKALIDDLDAIKSIADASKAELGFVLRPALMASIRREEVLVAVTRSQIAAFVEYHHRKDRQTTLYHIAVSKSYHRQGVGQALLQALHYEAESLGKTCIMLRCPIDLSANHFYEGCGFYLAGTENGKQRPLNVWVLNLP
jgi:N-acetylglutamate synthase-like GNAT family acetyltransferase